jgi:hypothetical protein
MNSEARPRSPLGVPSLELLGKRPVKSAGRPTNWLRDPAVHEAVHRRPLTPQGGGVVDEVEEPLRKYG